MAKSIVAELDRLAREHDRPFANAVYRRSDFRELYTRGGKRTQRYVNLETGEQVSRRKHDELIGRPLPAHTKQQQRERLAQAIANGQGIVIDEFEGEVDSYERGKRGGGTVERHRNRRLRAPVEVGSESAYLQDAIDAWAEGNDAETSDAFQHAFLTTWWNGGDGSIESISQIRLELVE